MKTLLFRKEENTHIEKPNITDKKGEIRAVTKSGTGKKHDKKIFDETRLILPENSDLTGDLGHYETDGIILPNKKQKGQELTKEEK